jgi:hypothetical protein
MVQPQSDPPVKSQPEGATERSRDTRKAPPPAWPASCLFPGSNWTEGPRESHHLVCPAQPGVLQRGLRAPTSRGLGTVWPDSGRRAETGQRDREGQKQKRFGKRPEQERNTRGEGGAARHTEPQGQEGSRQLSWRCPGPGLACSAWPGPAPSEVQLSHAGPTTRSVLPWGCQKINGVQDKRFKKLFVLLSHPNCNGQGLLAQPCTRNPAPPTALATHGPSSVGLGARRQHGRRCFPGPGGLPVASVFPAWQL